jgi:hypothetical protein
VIGVITVAAIVILALMFLLVLGPEDEGEVKEMTMQEFMDDYEDSDGDGEIDNLRSLDEGDIVRIRDTVRDIHYDYDADMTLILCDSVEDLEFSFPLILDGDQSDQLEIGDPISAIWQIKRYEINGMSVEIPKEVYSYLMGYGLVTETTTTPVAALSFTEQSPGNYTGSIISLNEEVMLSEVSITIIDVSDGSSASQDPVQSGIPITTSGGLNLTFTDTNGNSRMDAGDVWVIKNGADGDQIKMVYETGSVIATYTLY